MNKLGSKSFENLVSILNFSYVFSGYRIENFRFHFLGRKLLSELDEKGIFRNNDIF